jgi:putative transposase
MGRLRRRSILLNGGYYHVFTRGNNRKTLFETDGDYRFFLEILQKYQQILNVGIVHYCLMPNHLHLMIQAILAADLPAFMQRILQVYARYFRQRQNHVGYVFQNRYKSVIIRNQVHLLECARYIERNPLRAGLVTNLADYKWSSYRLYALGKPDPTVKYINPLYLSLDKDPLQRMESYKKLFAEERLYDDIVDKEFEL